MTLRDLLPPIALRAARQLRSRYVTFPSYEAARQECGAAAYEATQLVEVVYRKTLAYREALAIAPPPLSPSDSLALFAVGLASRGDAPIRVLDFGGACGAHYFRLKALFRREIPLRWHVVETATMAERASTLATAELSFFTSVAQARQAAGDFDIVFSSGTLPFVPDPRQSLADLLGADGRFVVLPRLGLTEGTSAVIVVHQSLLSENGPGAMPSGMVDAKVRYPTTFLPRAEVETLMGRNYDFILTVQDDSGVFPVNREPLIGLGYVAQRRSDTVGSVGTA